jgi:hypothetical protein
VLLGLCYALGQRKDSRRTDLEADLVDGSGAKKYPEIDARCGADTPQIGAGHIPEAPAADVWPALLPKNRLLTLEGLDRRTAAYRETKQLIEEISGDLGGADHLSAAERQMVQHGAVLGAYATDLEAQYLRGRRIDLTALCTILNTQRRCFDAIGYRRRPRDVTPSLEGFLAKLEKADQ